jgi:hypothetical protein
MVEVILQSRYDWIEKAINDCADGKLPFSGPGSLTEMVAKAGYKTTSLHEMVCAAEAARRRA